MTWFQNFEFLGPKEAPDQREVPIGRTLELSEAEAGYLRQIEGLGPVQWLELPFGARLEALRELEHRLADIEGRPPLEVRSEALGPGQCGYFDRGRGVMVVAESLLHSRSPLVAIDTVAHEGRHAYQHFAVLHPEVHDDPFEVAMWAENFENYLTAEMYGYEAYRDQPVEADAWAAGELVRTVFSGSVRSEGV